MRPFEVAFVAALFISLASSIAALIRTGPPSGFLSRLSFLAFVLGAIALLLHLTREGAHWQMLPAYLAVLPTSFLLFHALSRKPATPWINSLLGICLLLATCACSYVVPMFRLPAPTGPYKVGTTILHMVDESRLEDAAPAPPGAKRELMVQIWYPTDAATGNLAPYRRRQETTLKSAYQSILPTHSFLDAPVARTGAPYPVLLFNPGWTGRRTSNTFLTEELASHGYIVAAIDHTYNSTPVALPDGRVIQGLPNAKVGLYLDTNPEEVETILNKEADKQALDDRFVLDQLTQMNAQQGSQWYGALDTANAGALGHSLGGAVSVETWATDPRIHAAINLDGWTLGVQAASGVRAASAERPGQAAAPPLLFLFEEGYYPEQHEVATPPANGNIWAPHDVEAAVDNWDRAHVKLLIARYGGYWINIKGTIHPTFTDGILTSPISRFSGVGPIDPHLALNIIRDYSVQFFDQALKNKPSPLLAGDQQNKYAEIQTSLNTSVKH